jgi:hypothetical protein
MGCPLTLDQRRQWFTKHEAPVKETWCSRTEIPQLGGSWVETKMILRSLWHSKEYSLQGLGTVDEEDPPFQNVHGLGIVEDDLYHLKRIMAISLGVHGDATATCGASIPEQFSRVYDSRCPSVVERITKYSAECSSWLVTEFDLASSCHDRESTQLKNARYKNALKNDLWIIRKKGSTFMHYPSHIQREWTVAEGLIQWGANKITVEVVLALHPQRIPQNTALFECLENFRYLSTAKLKWQHPEWSPEESLLESWNTFYDSERAATHLLLPPKISTSDPYSKSVIHCLLLGFDIDLRDVNCKVSIAPKPQNPSFDLAPKAIENYKRDHALLVASCSGTLIRVNQVAPKLWCPVTHSFPETEARHHHQCKGLHIKSSEDINPRLNEQNPPPRGVD